MYDKEMMVVVFAVQKWGPYLIGHHFTILTDHQTLKYFLDQRLTTPVQQKWLLKLLGYNYTLEYRLGASNAAADALSCRSDLLSLMGISQPLFDCVSKIQNSYTADSSTAKLFQDLLHNPYNTGSFKLQGNLIYYKTGIFVPSISQWRARLLQEFHASPSSGHSGLHGMPVSIVSDRDPIFLTEFWTAFFKHQQTALCKSSAYHPQTDGQTEVLNRTLEHYLRSFAMDKLTTWIQWLSWAEWWYNTTFQSTIKMTPFQAVYGYPPPTVQSYLPGSSPIHLVDVTLRNRDTILKHLKENMHMAQQRMRQQADKHGSEMTFQVGDWVFLKLQPYRQTSVSKTHCPKLAPRYYGPFQVLAHVGQVAYTLDLPLQSRIHPTFHVSLLKPKLGAHSVTSVTLPPVAADGSLLWFPECILQRGMFRRHNKAITRWLIKWQGLPEHDATWEDADSIVTRFQILTPEDRLVLWGCPPSRLITLCAPCSAKPTSSRSESAAAEASNEAFIQAQNDTSESQWTVEIGNASVPSPVGGQIELERPGFLSLGLHRPHDFLDINGKCESSS
ncbi:uncharacterized protein LOC126622788 [Malus sylvestris]|uniref:uncharacterized protein LOC126622788 n=1 Tax=Malus sylvestris TaxID=3752 RepID=UPI0021AD05F5|nr:uncharacterized protein LOC126622788 [Malus sylvestris]